MAASLIPMKTQKRTVTYYVDTSTVYTATLKKGADALTNLSFTPSKSGYTFVGWRENTTASSSILASKIVGSSDITLYAVFAKAITVTYYASTTASSETGLLYYNNGNVVYPSFTIDNAALDGWTFRGWCTSTSATATVVYSSISNTTIKSSVTYYAKFSKTITLSYSGNGSTSGSVSSQTGTRYYNTAGNYSNPSFTLASNGYTKTNYVFLKWASGSTSGTQYSAGASVTLTASTTFYAIWDVIVRIALTRYWYTEDHDDDDTSWVDDGVVQIRFYNNATGATLYSYNHGFYSTFGTSQQYNHTDYCNVVNVYISPGSYARYTALQDLYSSSSLSSVALSSGSYANLYFTNGSYITTTYYVQYSRCSF